MTITYREKYPTHFLPVDEAMKVSQERYVDVVDEGMVQNIQNDRHQG